MAGPGQRLGLFENHLPDLSLQPAYNTTMYNCTPDTIGNANQSNITGQQLPWTVVVNSEPNIDSNDAVKCNQQSH